jgi:hypothetical protein
MSRGRVFLVTALLTTGAALAAACVGELSHAFGGYAYDSQQMCLEASGAIDVVAGADPGQCPMLRCWEAPDGTIYVTDEACDAPPDYVDHTHDGFPACVKALALYAEPEHDQCVVPEAGAGGGSIGF